MNRYNIKALLFSAGTVQPEGRLIAPGATVLCKSWKVGRDASLTEQESSYELLDPVLLIYPRPSGRTVQVYTALGMVRVLGRVASFAGYRYRVTFILLARAPAN